jgi:hypothetical protein
MSERAMDQQQIQYQRRMTCKLRTTGTNALGLWRRIQFCVGLLWRRCRIWSSFRIYNYSDSCCGLTSNSDPYPGRKCKDVPVPNSLCTTYLRHNNGWRYRTIILDCDTRWKWVVSFTLQLLYTVRGATFTQSRGDWVGPGAGLGAVEKRNVLQYRESNLGSQARSLLLYREKYPGSYSECFKLESWAQHRQC